MRRGIPKRINRDDSLPFVRRIRPSTRPLDAIRELAIEHGEAAAQNFLSART